MKHRRRTEPETLTSTLTTAIITSSGLLLHALSMTSVAFSLISLCLLSSPAAPSPLLFAPSPHPRSRAIVTNNSKTFQGLASAAFANARIVGELP